MADDVRVKGHDETLQPSIAPGLPAVRAKFLQQWIVLAEQAHKPAAGRLIERIGADTRRKILATTALSWLPIEVDIQVVDTVAEVLGPERFSALSRAFFMQIMPKPPLSALLDIGTKLIGLSPQSFVRWWDKGWGAVYRSCGTVAGFVDGEGRARVVHRHMPQLCVRSDAFVEAMLGTTYGVFAFTGTSGTVRLRERRVLDGYVEIELDWRNERSIHPLA